MAPVAQGLARSVVLLCLVLAFTEAAIEPYTCKQDFSYFAGSEHGMTASAHGVTDGCYKVFTSKKTWSQARDHCASWAINGSLAASRHPVGCPLPQCATASTTKPRAAFVRCPATQCATHLISCLIRAGAASSCRNVSALLCVS